MKPLAVHPAPEVRPVWGDERDDDRALAVSAAVACFALPLVSLVILWPSLWPAALVPAGIGVYAANCCRRFDLAGSRLALAAILAATGIAGLAIGHDMRAARREVPPGFKRIAFADLMNWEDPRTAAADFIPPPEGRLDPRHYNPASGRYDLALRKSLPLDASRFVGQQITIKGYVDSLPPQRDEFQPATIPLAVSFEGGPFDVGTHLIVKLTPGADWRYDPGGKAVSGILTRDVIEWNGEEVAVYSLRHAVVRPAKSRRGLGWVRHSPVPDC